MDVRNSDFFVAGGGLPPDAPSYVTRPADTELCDLCLRGEPGYVLAGPQMGKSSLMIHAAGHLPDQASAAIIYLSSLSAGAGVESWYLELINRLKFHLKLAVNAEAWWKENNSLKAAPRFAHFIREVVLSEAAGSVVIFFDEIESLLGQKFAADFLAALRSIYQARADEPGYRRMNFIFLGAALPADLIKDASRSPFSIAGQITLGDFSRDEASPLQHGLAEVYPEQAQAIFSRIYYWTGGQPYLTQKLCRVVTEMDSRQWSVPSVDPVVDRLVEKLFLSPTREDDLNLLGLRNGLAHHPQRRRLLALYRQVYEGGAIAADKQALDQQRLKLLGLVREEKGSLKVRNMIYRQVFNLNRLKTSPAQGAWMRYLVVGLILAAVVATVWLGLAVYNRFEQVIAAQAQPFLDSFSHSTNPNVRLASLAGLFKLPGYQEQARRSFFDELNRNEQLALFEVADPHASGPDLVTVIQGVYIAPNLKNNEQDNAVLQAMAEPLKQLVDDASTPGAVSLELEITQWLKGREFYNQGDYRQAVSAYNLAIDLNDRNPGTFFDRGLAYTALDELGLALADFSTVLRLDQNWQPSLQQALMSDSRIYNALWAGSENSQDLIALVPTPTNTPIPTDPPTLTPTPLPTPTSTPRPPTATPTATAPPTRAPTVQSKAPSATPAAGPTLSSGAPAGVFTLLAPSPATGPSYGPTHFEWQWSGPLPAEYGFEVRVWRDGQQPAGVHNAELDNKNGGAVKSLGNNKYALDVDIKDAAGVVGHSGEYLWTVALVRISPKYKDLGPQAPQAPPGRLTFAAPGGGGGGGGKGGGGGVGID